MHIKKPDWLRNNKDIEGKAKKWYKVAPVYGMVFCELLLNKEHCGRADAKDRRQWPRRLASPREKRPRSRLTGNWGQGKKKILGKTSS